MVYDLRNLQTNYMPVVGPYIPFLALYSEERGGRQNRPSLYADICE